MTFDRVAFAGLATAGLVLAGALPALAQKARPPAQITIANARSVALNTLEIATASDQPRLVAKLARPLAPGARVALKLSKASGCAYYVLARFEDNVESDAESMDLCKDKVIRLTE